MTQPPHATRNDLLSRSGLEFMRALLDCTLQGPPIGEKMGFELTLVEDGKVAFVGAPTKVDTNPMGSVHGGWYGAILDSALGCAVMTKVPKGAVYTTLEYKINITRELPIGVRTRAVATVNHAGRSTGIATAELRGIDNKKLYATGSTTCIIMAVS